MESPYAAEILNSLMQMVLFSLFDQYFKIIAENIKYLFQ